MHRIVVTVLCRLRPHFPEREFAVFRSRKFPICLWEIPPISLRNPTIYTESRAWIACFPPHRNGGKTWREMVALKLVHVWFSRNQSKFVQVYVLPVLTKTTKHPWMHPPNSVFFDMPTQKSPNVIKTFQNCASCSPKLQTRNPWNQQCQTNRKMPKTIFC